jgi:hypothetical protein
MSIVPCFDQANDSISAITVDHSLTIEVTILWLNPAKISDSIFVPTNMRQPFADVHDAINTTRIAIMR